MEVPWHEVDRILQGLATDAEHSVEVRREAIPLIFVPGIMGSRLRLAGSDGTGSNAQGLPNLRWDTDTGWLFGNLAFRGAERRKALVIGDAFDPDYLEPDNDSPAGNGFRSVIRKYDPILNTLKNHDWGVLGKLFTFPVYAFGYNWTGDAAAAGAKLAARIVEIKSEAEAATGRCEGVILITHSMGGLVARAACKLAGAAGDVLGVVHGVQPAWGSPAAYWRIKAGFEGGGIENTIVSFLLGSDGRRTTVILGNSIGGLELLPNKHYVRNDGTTRSWLAVTDTDGRPWMPDKPARGNPYDEIYRVRAEVEKPATGNPSTNTWWGLIDPDLLRPEYAGAGNDDNAIDAVMGEAVSAWDSYLGLLAQAEAFHDAVGTYSHSRTHYFWGTGHATAETIRYEVESNWVWSDPYRTRGFLGLFRNAAGEQMQAVLQAPDGDGDATVPVSSARFAGAAPAACGDPAPQPLPVEHQPAYDDGQTQQFTVCAVTAIVHERFKAMRGA